MDRRRRHRPGDAPRSLACQKLRGGDTSQAYLHADLPEQYQYYMHAPMSARHKDEQGRRVVWKVLKSLYGGKNSGRNWYLL